MKVCAILVVIGMILTIIGMKSGDIGTGMLGFGLVIFCGFGFFVALGKKLSGNNADGVGTTNVNVTHNHYGKK